MMGVGYFTGGEKSHGDATERRNDWGNQAAGTAFAEATAGQVRCLSTPSCMETKPRPRASAPSWRNWWRRCSEGGLPRCHLPAVIVPARRHIHRGRRPSREAGASVVLSQLESISVGLV